VRFTPPALALLLLGACQAPAANTSAFTTTPGVTTVPDSSDSSSTSSSSSTGSSGSGSIDGGTSEASGSTDTTASPIPDVGDPPDFTGDSPVGCEGKIDFLFVVSRDANMSGRQEQLALAVPTFISTIESKFADFDYHIMVVDGDDEWGNSVCTENCPDLSACKVGQDCCSWYLEEYDGMPCCIVQDYPCEYAANLPTCELAFGAGTVYPAGREASNKLCPIDGGHRYLVKDQTDLPKAFACIAKVGASGDNKLGQALTAAMQPAINDFGGCNEGFLREDALLMVTFIQTNPDEPGWDGSEGTPAEWYQAVLDAKRGDAESVVMFNIGGCNCGPHEGECHPKDRLCTLTTMFPYHHQESALASDYGPAFNKAVGLVETACAEFVPPPG
jgi:hypothetical protein